MKENLIVIKTADGLQSLIDYIKVNDFIAVDTETTGVDKESKIIGFSISAHVDTGYYVVLSEWNVIDKELRDLDTKDRAFEVLCLLLNKNLIMHNAIFDVSMVFNNFGIDLMPYLHTDTMILGHLLDENRSNGLKELGTSLFGEESKLEQTAMKDSVIKNGGVLTKALYELYKADSDIMGKYGAKDAILTIKLFYVLVEKLYEYGLEEFFYTEESMPLLKGAGYDLNTHGLKIDPQRLSDLKGALEADCMQAQVFIDSETKSYVSEKYPGTSKAKTFNIGSSRQLSWLLFIRLNNEFSTLTKDGKLVCKSLGIKVPYSPVHKREFIRVCTLSKGQIFEHKGYNPSTRKTLVKDKLIGDVWNYLAVDKGTLAKFSHKYKWVDRLLELNKNTKLLSTYVEGIQSRMKYNIIRPSFLQHGTSSGRYSCKNPNFMNLPRDDKRVKACIVSRPGKVFVGADYNQLEPRIFASLSGDERLLNCFSSGDDFYSVIGSEVFSKPLCSLKKDEPGSFAKRYPALRQIAKVIALSVTYGTTAPKLSGLLGKSMQEAQEIIDDYFEKFPKIRTFMLDSHNEAMEHGEVVSMFGRVRRIPKALDIKRIYGDTEGAKLPYDVRNALNLAVNFKVQSVAASIVNRASIAFKNRCRKLSFRDSNWNEVKIVLNIHDELIVECPEALAEAVVVLLKHSMETTVHLPGVDLTAEPKIAKDIADLK